MSQAAPGWYPLPSKPGVMGQWDGNNWTGNERSMPPSADAQPIHTDPIPPVGNPLNYGSAPQSYHPQFGSQQSPGAWTPESIIETVKREAQRPGTQATGKQALGGAMIADGIVGFGKDRPSIFGAIGTIIFGVVWLVFTSFITGAMTSGNELASGEVKMQGKVIEIVEKSSSSSSSSSKRSTSNSKTCSPIAEFTVNGTVYTTTTSGSVSPCPWRVGQSVDVLYDPNDVNNTSRVPGSKGTNMIATMFPLVGVLVIVGGIWTLLVRLGTIAGGIYFWRKGSQQNEALRRKAGR